MAKQGQKLTKRQRESKKINRKRAVRQWWKHATRRCVIIGIAFFTLVSLVGGIWAWRSSERISAVASDISNGIWQQTAKFGFKVNNVYLEGRKSASVPEVMGAIGLHAGAPILGISLPDMRKRLEAIPRVKYAEVARVLPDQLHVRLVEREPVAIWQNEGKLRLVDDDGVAMEYGDPAQYGNLLLVVGPPDAAAHVHELLVMLAMEPEMYSEVAAVLRIGERRWNIRFKNGIELKLPENNAAAAWQDFAKMERESHLLERAVKSVDMRLSDRIFIKYAPSETSPASKGAGSET